MRILHTEASTGWGGQERRIFHEALGMQARGHQIFFAVQKGSELGKRAREVGFVVYELNISKSPLTLFKLIFFILQKRIEIVNTHSSLDAWLAGLAAKICRKKIIRTRHLSTPVKKGLNSTFLYNLLAHTVVTTCKETKETIAVQAKLSEERICSIPTGVAKQFVSKEEIAAFRKKYGIDKNAIVAGTLCILRGWKGVSDLLHAASELRDVAELKWLVVGSGVSEEYFLSQWRELKLEGKVIFTGHSEKPIVALAAMDIFLLLSWANEGVSQATLQAASLKKPLITTATGGLKEVCVEGKTGLIVPPHDSKSVSKAVMKLFSDAKLRAQMGEEAARLVSDQFTFENMLDQMEKIYGKSH